MTVETDRPDTAMPSLHLSLRSRLYLGFALLTAFGLGMAGSGMLGLSAIAASIGKLELISTSTIHLQELLRNIEVIRRASNRYRIDASPESLDEIRQAEASTAAILSGLESRSASDERRKLFANIASELREAVTEADAFASAYQIGAAERAKLFTMGDALTAATTRLVDASKAAADHGQAAAAARAETAILLVRLVNWRFLATLDPKGMATFKTNADNAEAALDALGQVATDTVKPLMAPVRDALSAYRSGFESASAHLIAGAGHLDEGLRPHLHSMEKDALAASASQMASFTQRVADSQASADETMWLQGVVAVVATAIGGVLAFLIGRGIAGPIGSMTAAMTRLAEGDHAVEVPARENRDEIGAMARAVEVFKQNAIENARLAEAKIREQAARDRRQAAMDQHTKDFGKSISGVMGSLGDSAANLQAAARSMADAATRTRSSTSGAVEGASASARDLNSVAVAAEEMAASIQEISRQVAHVTAAVGKAVDRAAETDTRVAGLAETADRIGDVVRLINDIAGQTNLLALNATIEAARAGDAGKGFAVVASEVKTLATQTARATDQIGAQIVAIRAATGEAVDAVRDVGQAIAQVSSVATAIAAAVEEQAAATQEISASVQTVTRATARAAQAMEDVLSIAGETDTASRSVLSAADEVGTTSVTLRDEVNDFLTGVRRIDSGERAA